MKECRKCGEARPMSDYYIVKKTGKPRDWCKPCVISYVKQWQRDNPERVYLKQRRSDLKRFYGLTPEAYQELLDKHGNKCAICGGSPRLGTPLHVDHCHTSGKVRGLLCTNCNQALGQLRDDLSILRRAVEYLECQ